MKVDGNQELSDEQKAFVKKVVRDPVLFATHVLGVDLWRSEIELLRSIQKNRRTAVKACQAVGKTFTLAIAALWWLARYPEGIVLTTSSTERQVRTQVWNEIRSLAEKAKIPYPKLKSTELKFRGENNFAIGFSTNQAENFQGYHGKYVLIITDEAPGIASEVWDAIAATMAGGKVHIVISGNPTRPSGPFYDAFTRDRGLWNCFTIGAFDSPNLKGLTLEQLLSMNPAEGGPLDENPLPYLIRRRWVYEQHQTWWHGSPGSSPTWLARVLAQFPEQDKDALIKMAWLESARRRAVDNPVVDDGKCPLIAGVDVGGGEAETVVYICEYRRGLRRIIKMDAWRADDTRGQVVNFLNQFRPRLSLVRVDAIGVGHNFALHLRDYQFPVELVNVAMACESKPNFGENDPARRFVNLKAQFYQELADAFERGEIEGLTDETTIGQLAGILCELDSQGRTKIESKESARARGIRSPDRAEALMLAMCKPPQKFEYTPVRPQQQRAAEESDGGPELADFIADSRSSRSRMWDGDGIVPGSLARYFRRHRGGAW